jgi:DNA repair protein SbcD/Mre11
MKFIYFTDPHFSAQGPVSRTDDYMATTFNKLDEIKTIAKKEKVDFMAISGDFYNFKSWARNPYLLTNKLIDYFISLEFQVYGIFGDHDLMDRQEANLERQPLGTLAKAAKIRLLSKGEEVHIGEGVWVTGSPKTDDYESHIDNYVPKKIKDSKYHIHMVHGDLYLKKPVYEPWTSYDQLKSSSADVTLRGHIHRNDGIYEVGKTKIVGIGSLTRGTFSTDSINRRPSIAIINTDTKDIKVIELKSAPPTNKIFDLVKVEKEEKAEAEIDKLGDLIKQEASEIEINSLEGIKQLVKESKSIDKEVKEICYELLEKSQEYV